MSAPLTVTRIVIANRNAEGVQSRGDLQFAPGASLSPDGTKVAFHSDSGDLVAGDTNRYFDVFVKDLQTGEVVRYVPARLNRTGMTWAASGRSLSGTGPGSRSEASNPAIQASTTMSPSPISSRRPSIWSTIPKETTGISFPKTAGRCS
ncbi:hypothetical protein [Azospirillum thermophilum]|uniref:hypothetical protein n=1 Tax=Azospirillum thermophilum TaxID=2202148 RepID=UPI00143D4941|nr:hypothetical protein [Azospirillum thermophilum]